MGLVIDDLAYYVCYDCGHSFYTLDLPLGINEPKFCAYCGTSFEEVIEVDEDDLRDM
jgi:rRNA maturation endonuclease Nob1